MFAALAERGQKAAAKAEPYDLWAPVRQGGQASSESCGCQDKAPARRAQQQSDGPTVKIVSGDWLAEVMRLDVETTRQIAGQEVHLDAEAWGAVRSAQRARMAVKVERARIKRKRQEIWPEEGPKSDESPSGQVAVLSEEEQSFQQMKAANTASPVMSSKPDCDCTATGRLTVGPWYVDSELGSDDNGGQLEVFDDVGTLRAVLLPWRTLRQVEWWLNELARRYNLYGLCIEGAEVYLRCGRIWDGTEERTVDWPATPPIYSPWDDMATILEIQDFKATEDAPLILSAYATEGELVTDIGGYILVDPDDVHRGAAARGGGVWPILAGKRVTMDSRTAVAPYEDKRVGISFMSCCHVAVSYLYVRGFGTGIDVRGHSKHHAYSNLHLYGLARWGLRFGVQQEDALYDATADYTVEWVSKALALRIHRICTQEDYPEDLTVSGCWLSSIGYDTAGTDIMLGFLTTNCTISGNHLSGDAVRGICGVESAGGSSGHLIEGNFISNHAKFCWLSGDYKAEFLTTTRGPLLLHPCSGQVGSLVAAVQETDYGYEQLWYSAPLYQHLGVVPADGQEANGENGICMKAMRPRTPTSRPTTSIRDNVIWGHTNFNGIVVYEGCQGVDVSGNQIFQNGTGVLVSNQDNTNAWYNDGDQDYYLEKTRDVNIYENVVYMNQREGVLVNTSAGTVSHGPTKGTPFVPKVSDVYIFWNTIAHNLYQGVKVTNNTTGSAYGDVDQIYLISNVIARNGRGGAPDEPRMHQVSWEGMVCLDMSSSGCTAASAVSDYNCYLGWVTPGTWSTLGPQKVIYWAKGAEYSWTPGSERSLSRGGAAWRWGVEQHGSEFSELTDLDFASDGELEILEGSNGAFLEGNVTDSDLVDTLLSLDYSMGSDSRCIAAGLVVDVAPTPRLRHQLRPTSWVGAFAPRTSLSCSTSARRTS